MTEDVKRWEGRVVEGRYPLRRFLGGSECSAVFLTEIEGGQNVAIKFSAVNSGTADAQLTRWKQAMEFSHPNLIRLFEAGRCRMDDEEFLFVIMEYAEEDLSQILPQRALSTAEAQEMLKPVIGALGYLHGKGWIHGHLKPSNILALGDQVKISSEGIARVGERANDRSRMSVYDPPEKEKGRNSAAGDVWSLGVTITEVLTRQVPKPNGKEHGELRLPEGLSSPFLDIARNCLWRDPQQRWAVSDIASRLNSASTAKQNIAAPAPEPVAPAVAEKPKPSARPEADKPELSHLWLWALLAIALVVGGIYLVARKSSPVSNSVATSEPASAKSETPAAAPAQSESQRTNVPAAKQQVPASAGSGDEIVERVVPTIPKSARDTVTGKVKVRVRVQVDASGKVVGTKFEEHGPSQYFARQAQQAAEQWKFAPAADAQRQWVLRFEFGRGGTQVFPSRVANKH